jgi:hypothetical protein
MAGRGHCRQDALASSRTGLGRCPPIRPLCTEPHRKRCPCHLGSSSSSRGADAHASGRRDHRADGINSAALRFPHTADVGCSQAKADTRRHSGSRPLPARANRPRRSFPTSRLRS